MNIPADQQQNDSNDTQKKGTNAVTRVVLFQKLLIVTFKVLKCTLQRKK